MQSDGVRNFDVAANCRVVYAARRVGDRREWLRRVRRATGVLRCELQWHVALVEGIGAQRVVVAEVCLELDNTEAIRDPKARLPRLLVLELSVLVAEVRGRRRVWAQEARLVGQQRAVANPKPWGPNQRPERKPLYDVPLGAEREDRVPLVAAGTDSGKKLSLLTAERKQPRESRLVIVAGLGKTHPEPEPEGAVGHRGPGAGDLVDERFEPGVSGVGDPIDSIIHRYVRCLIDAAGRPCHAPGDGDAESQIARVGERRSDYYAEVPRH